MHVKASMRPIDRKSLSDHEVKRCRAVARGQHWEVWEESILWWSPDQQRWQPLEEGLLPRRRRWLIVEGEEGLQAALIWDVGDTFTLPATSEHTEAAPERERI
jgi:hypothetical protein